MQLCFQEMVREHTGNKQRMKKTLINMDKDFSHSHLPLSYWEMRSALVLILLNVCLYTYLHYGISFHILSSVSFFHCGIPLEWMKMKMSGAQGNKWIREEATTVTTTTTKKEKKKKLKCKTHFDVN